MALKNQYDHIYSSPGVAIETNYICKRKHEPDNNAKYVILIGTCMFLDVGKKLPVCHIHWPGKLQTQHRRSYESPL